VDELRQRDVRATLSDQPGSEVEVVVVQEDGRLRLAVELLHHDLGEALVDRDVSVVPRVVQAAVPTRRLLEVPEVVLEKPQRRIRNDVVEPVVRLRVVRDQAVPVRRPVAGRLLEQLVPGLDRDVAILLAHRARDPRDVVHRDEAP